jgi:8-oxo-dGTP pyrophosphatase MutT (NUDIX family)
MERVLLTAALYYDLQPIYDPSSLPVIELAAGSTPGCYRDMSKRQEPRVQFAALPFRLVEERLEVLLITSRETRRWIIPKGWAEKGTKPRTMAAREAFEEAGVRGKVGKLPYGSYRYEKRLTEKRSVEWRGSFRSATGPVSQAWWCVGVWSDPGCIQQRCENIR